MKDSNTENNGGRVEHVDADRLAYLRKRSLHRLWWNSARVTLGREQRKAAAFSAPGFHASPPTGKRT